MDPKAPMPDEALEHMWNAAHEFLQAMRALVEAADHFVEQQRAPRAATDAHEPRLHRIDIDIDDERDLDAHDLGGSWP